MDWLNYHHLLYFWMAAKEGSISRACQRLHLAQPTLSNQIRKLENSIGSKLFERRGRSLVLTETGQVTFRYADEIFSLGEELREVLRGRDTQGVTSLAVGVPDVLPKLVVYQLLQPALELPEPIRLVLYEGKLDQLLADLGMHRLDVVLADSPLGAGSPVKAFHHLLGECPLTVFGTKTLAQKYRKGFPKSLDGAPMLIPTQNTNTRRALDQWFDQQSIRPSVKHEFEDSALLKVFGQGGHGLFCGPSAIERQICQQYDAQIVGRLDSVVERFYAISVERRLKHPAIVAMTESARKKLFRETPPNG